MCLFCNILFSRTITLIVFQFYNLPTLYLLNNIFCFYSGSSVFRPFLKCSVFGDRCFSIEKRHLDILGYGRDHSGSLTYLADTLSLLLPYNDNRYVMFSKLIVHCFIFMIVKTIYTLYVNSCYVIQHNN